MLKIDYGTISDTNDTKQKDIIVRAMSPNTLKDVMIGGALVVMGVIYLTATAFKRGGDKYLQTEYAAMRDIGLINGDDTEVPIGKWCK